jgi:hypothetical protein
MPIATVEFNVNVTDHDKNSTKMENVPAAAYSSHDTFMNVTYRNSILNDRALEDMKVALKNGNHCFDAPWDVMNQNQKNNHDTTKMHNDDDDCSTVNYNHDATSNHESSDKENEHESVKVEARNSENCDSVSTKVIDNTVKRTPSYHMIPGTNPPIYVASDPALHEMLLMKEMKNRMSPKAHDRDAMTENEANRRRRSRNVRHVESYNENNLQNENMINNSTVIAAAAGSVKRIRKRNLRVETGDVDNRTSKKMQMPKRASSATETQSESLLSSSYASLGLPAPRQKTAVLLAKKRKEKQESQMKHHEAQKEAAISIANELLNWMETLDTSQGSTQSQEQEQESGKRSQSMSQSAVSENGAVNSNTNSDSASAAVDSQADQVERGNEEMTVPNNNLTSVTESERYDSDYFMPSSPSSNSIQSLCSWLDSDSSSESPSPSASSSPLPTDHGDYNSPVFTFPNFAHSTTPSFYANANNYLFFDGTVYDPKHHAAVETDTGMMQGYNASVFSL